MDQSSGAQPLTATCATRSMIKKRVSDHHDRWADKFLQNAQKGSPVFEPFNYTKVTEASRSPDHKSNYNQNADIFNKRSGSVPQNSMRPCFKNRKFSVPERKAPYVNFTTCVPPMLSPEV